jgi:hypothetical protein
MKTEVPRYVIEDLLPLYLAGEMSEDTHQWIEQYLNTEEEMKAMVDEAKRINKLVDPKVSLNKDAELRAYEKVQEFALGRLLILVGAGLLVVFCLIATVASLIALSMLSH